mmetsp:Transcript_1087/g.3721  ORF Transcript_1087/g.3721 Transcript_1087/m.3721 type:complete len:85 (-) Transcript_1087:2707-2961(-)
MPIVIDKKFRLRNIFWEFTLRRLLGFHEIYGVFSGHFESGCKRKGSLLWCWKMQGGFGKSEVVVVTGKRHSDQLTSTFSPTPLK